MHACESMSASSRCRPLGLWKTNQPSGGSRRRQRYSARRAEDLSPLGPVVMRCDMRLEHEHEHDHELVSATSELTLRVMLRGHHSPAVLERLLRLFGARQFLFITLSNDFFLHVARTLTIS